MRKRQQGENEDFPEVPSLSARNELEKLGVRIGDRLAYTSSDGHFQYTGEIKRIPAGDNGIWITVKSVEIVRQDGDYWLGAGLIRGCKPITDTTKVTIELTCEDEADARMIRDTVREEGVLELPAAPGPWTIPARIIE